MKTIKVNDMSCMHCVQKIQKSLLSDDIEGIVDVSTHSVKVNENDLEKAIVSIKKAGYTPEVWLGFMQENIKIVV